MENTDKLQRIIENITSTYNCFENDRCCNKTEFEETEAELDEIIQFINNQDKQLQASKDECNRLKKLIIPELECKIIVLESEKKGLKNILADLNKLLENYYNWLKEKTDFKQINDYYEITTPYLDRHNDYIQIYLKKYGNDFILTDDGYTIEDLIQSGCSLDTPNRKKMLQITLNGYGVNTQNEELIVKVNKDNFPLKKHSLVQAMLAVNDMFYLARPNVESLFFEDVKNWFDVSTPYTNMSKLVAKTALDKVKD